MPTPQERRRAIRQRLRKQSRTAATRLNRPLIQAERQKVQSAKRAGAKDAASYRGAIAAASRSIEGTSLKGLKGPYRKDLAKELAGRATDVKQSLPFLLADSRATTRTAVADARSGVIDAQAALQSDFATQYNSALDEARNNQGIIELERGDSEKQDARKAKKTDYRKAVAAADLIFRAGPEKGKWKAPATDQEWAQFERSLLSSDAVTDPRVARRAVEALRRRLTVPGAVQYAGESVLRGASRVLGR